MTEIVSFKVLRQPLNVAKESALPVIIKAASLIVKEVVSITVMEADSLKVSKLDSLLSIYVACALFTFPEFCWKYHVTTICFIVVLKLTYTS